MVKRPSLRIDLSELVPDPTAVVDVPVQVSEQVVERVAGPTDEVGSVPPDLGDD